VNFELLEAAVGQGAGENKEIENRMATTINVSPEPVPIADGLGEDGQTRQSTRLHSNRPHRLGQS
jgi:hypothetical protein